MYGQINKFLSIASIIIKQKMFAVFIILKLFKPLLNFILSGDIIKNYFFNYHNMIEFIY